MHHRNSLSPTVSKGRRLLECGGCCCCCCCCFPPPSYSSPSLIKKEAISISVYSDTRCMHHSDFLSPTVSKSATNYNVVICCCPPSPCLPIKKETTSVSAVHSDTRCMHHRNFLSPTVSKGRRLLECRYWFLSSFSFFPNQEEGDQC